MLTEEVQIQRERYARIAEEYEEIHKDHEHVVAFALLDGMLGYLQAKSVLDVGAGTGRTLRALSSRHPELRLMGVEPVAELRAVGHRNGVPAASLIDGNGYSLPFQDGEFDVVCEFGVLHHVREPERMVAEMLRVARLAIFVSDMNNFGGGRPLVRYVKRLLRSVGLWRAVNYIKTGGKGYSITRGDGLFYSYSVFESLPLVRDRCRAVHMMNTLPAGNDFYKSAEHVAILGIKTENREIGRWA
jgi:ubiquinone/menaquinone biosynthesis C-methylase UbiE